KAEQLLEHPAVADVLVDHARDLHQVHRCVVELALPAHQLKVFARERIARNAAVLAQHDIRSQVAKAIAAAAVDFAARGHSLFHQSFAAGGEDLIRAALPTVWTFADGQSVALHQLQGYGVCPPLRRVGPDPSLLATLASARSRARS